MSLKIINEKKQPLLSRVSYEMNIEGSKVTPSKDKIKEEISKKVKAKSELISIKKVYQHYGEAKVTVQAYVYSSKESLLKIEPPKKEVKKEGEEAAPKPEAQPKPEVKEEPKVEEKKEEAPKEEEKSE